MEIEIKKQEASPGDAAEAYLCTSDVHDASVNVSVCEDGLSLDLPGMGTGRGQASIEVDADLTNLQLQEASVRIMATAAFQLLAAKNESQK